MGDEPERGVVGKWGAGRRGVACGFEQISQEEDMVSKMGAQGAGGGRRWATHVGRQLFFNYGEGTGGGGVLMRAAWRGSTWGSYGRHHRNGRMRGITP